MKEPIHPLQAMIDGMNAAHQKERSKTQMTLGSFIAKLASLDPERKIIGVGSPISYRGYYSDLAFEPTTKIKTVGEVLAKARECMGRVFQGYKGGDFQMGESTPLWSSEYGTSSSDRIMDLNVTTDPISLVLEPEPPYAP